MRFAGSGWNHFGSQSRVALADFDGGTMLVDEVTIFSSELTRQGPVYDPLGFAPLRP